MRRIIVCGASFAGLTCARHLSNEQVEIHIVDPVHYLEYNPSNLRSLVDPQCHDGVMIPSDQIHITKDTTRFIRYHTLAISINDSSVKLQDGTILPYDYLVIAIGSNYANYMKPDHAFTPIERQAQIVEKNRELDSSELVTIVGAGLVGVELAAEVVVKYGTNKQCRLITRNNTILPMLPDRAQRYARNFLIENHVQIEDGQGHPVSHFITSAKSDEIVFDCTGITPARFPVFEMSSGSDALNAEAQTGFMKVNQFLQILPRVFCIGDCSNDPYGSTKLAYTAELQGEVTARNISSLIHHGALRELSAFPKSLSKVMPPPSVICCSLGPNDGVLCFNQISVTGQLAAWMKWFIERSKVGQYRGEWISRCVWKIGEPATFFMNMIYRATADCSARLDEWMPNSVQPQ